MAEEKIVFRKQYGDGMVMMVMRMGVRVMVVKMVMMGMRIRIVMMVVRIMAVMRNVLTRMLIIMMERR